MVSRPSNPITIMLLGRDYPSPGEQCIRAISERKIAVGISVGNKGKPNEDALLAAVSDEAVLLAVADGHWGSEASELAVRKSLEMYQSSARQPIGNELRGRLYLLFEQINRDLLNMAVESPGSPTPETSLIVCYVRRESDGTRLHWASFGDSYLFLQAGSALRQLNTLPPRWLGALSKLAETTGANGLPLVYPQTGVDRYFGVAAGMESGIEKLSTGDVLLLCTDGLIEPTGHESALGLTDLRPILTSNQTAEDQVRALVNLALERGGGDNIACILAEV